MKVKKTLSHFYPKIPKQLYKSFYIAVILILAFATCDLAFLNGNRSYQYSLVDENGNPIISNIPTDDFFYINIKSAYYTGDSNTFDPLDFELYAMNDGPGTDCKISVNEESGTEDLYCMLEISEGDLWYHEIKLEYNIPPAMCSYLAFMPHWHYNQPTGPGAQTVYECDIQTGMSDGEPTTEKRYSLFEPLANRRCDLNRIFKKEIKNLCPYDKSEEEGLTNCCYGKYNLIGEEANSGEWGEDLKQCIGGLARLNWDTFDKYGRPAVLVTQSGSKGINTQYELNPLIDKINTGFRVSLPSANYFSGMENKEWEDEAEPSFYTSNTTSTIQEKYKDAPFITWACLDQNKETKHAIRLIIREWNTQEEFVRFKESEGSSGDPDISGAEGSECENYENNVLQFGQCDDLMDADGFTAKKAICNEGCNGVKNICNEVCNTNKTTCDTNCTAVKTTCDTACNTDKTSCRTACGTVESTCEDGCTADKDACYQICETDCYREPKAACAKPKVICYERCRIHKEYRDVHCYAHANPQTCRGSSSTDHTTCRTACDTQENTCLRGSMATPNRCILTCERYCDSIKTTCDTDCGTVKTTCDTACNTNKTTCNTDCGTVKTACDTACDTNKTTCGTACDTTKNICDEDCSYPLIIYK